MRLFEYQSKKIFSQYGIPITRGRLTSVAGEAKHIAEELGGSVVIKAQVLVNGRGRAGGIRLAKNPEEAEQHALAVLGMEIKDHKVRKVLVDEAVSIAREIYVALIMDRSSRKPVLIASPEGGTYIEEFALQSPEKIIKIELDPLIGLCDYQAREIATSIDLPKQHWSEFVAILAGLWKVFWDNDATLAEINPLVISEDQRMFALDCKLLVDDNSYFRHPEFAELLDSDLLMPLDPAVRKLGISYFRLDGNIGCISNGTGLAMSIMDTLDLFGGKAANFLDLVGGANSNNVEGALSIVLEDPNVKSVLINIFGGLTHCDEAAKGIMQFLGHYKPAVPIIIRLSGTRSGEGLGLLKDSNLLIAETFVGGIQMAIAAAEGDLNEHFS